MAVSIYWPESLPCWLLDSHEGQDEDIYARTEVYYGPARLRRMYPSVPHIRKAALFLHGDKPKIFHAFFENDLDVGSRRFIAPFRAAGGLERFFECEFVEPYNAEYVALAGAKRAWRVQCNFRLYGEGQIASPYLEPAELSLRLGARLSGKAKVTPTASLSMAIGAQLGGVAGGVDFGGMAIGAQLSARTRDSAELGGMVFMVSLAGRAK